MSVTQKASDGTYASGSFVRFTDSVSRLTGSSLATVLAATAMLVWLLSGPFFHFSPGSSS
jgi:low affinity Fe/Cu permease